MMAYSLNRPSNAVSGGPTLRTPTDWKNNSSVALTRLLQILLCLSKHCTINASVAVPGTQLSPIPLNGLSLNFADRWRFWWLDSLHGWHIFGKSILMYFFLPFSSVSPPPQKKKAVIGCYVKLTHHKDFFFFLLCGDFMVFYGVFCFRVIYFKTQHAPGMAFFLAPFP